MNLAKDLLRSAGCPHGISLRAAGGRAFPEGSDAELLKNLILEGERQQSEPWSVMLMSDYREFRRTGNRVNFEDIQFSRRIKLSALVMAECAEHKGRFTDDIIDGLFLIMGESSWCLPAHNSYERDHPQEPLPDITRPVVDLFAAETAAVIAAAEALLRDELLEVSPFISRAVDAELEKRIFTPYLNGFFWWMGDGVQHVNNWTVWITQNILLAALTRKDPDVSFLKQVLEKAAASVDYFLDEYEDDGACDEGAQYYTHAALCLFGCLELMDRALDGAIAPAFKNERVKNIAAYITRVYAGNGYYINFADCAARAGRRDVRDFLFGRRCSLPALMAHAAADYEEETWKERLLSDEHNLWYRLLQAENHEEMLELARKTADDSGKGVPAMISDTAGDFFFPSVGMMVARDDRFVLAAKAGDNGDSHNHNDVGSIIVYKDGKPFIIDLGVETYTAKTFSPQRYEIWTMQSQYHSTPLFFSGGDAIQQRDGERYAASGTRYSPGGDVCTLTSDIAGAWGDERIKSSVREASLIKGTGVDIKDSFETELACALVFITCEKPVAEPCGRIRIGDLGEITFDGADTAGIRIETLPITDERLKKSWDHDCYRIIVPVIKKTIATFLR